MMPATCETQEPANLTDHERWKRKQAIDIVGKALSDALELGYVIQVCYSEGYFFMEPRSKKP